MFLRKIVTIKGVARFRAAAISGGEYRKFNLVYAGNGRGKSTVCAVFRSFAHNDPLPILKRQTFGFTGQQEIQLLLDSGPARFAAQVWNKPAPEGIHIFDEHFVNTNVHGGNQVDLLHRRNFYRVIVGPNGVRLAEAIDQLDADATAIQQKITLQKRVIEQHIPKGMTIAQYLKLKEETDIDAKIAAAEMLHKAVEAAAVIAKHPELEDVILPSLPPDFMDIMASSLATVAKDTATRIQLHLNKHQFDKNGEEWLSIGLAHIQGDECPFCATSIAGNSLIDVYSGYFSQAYNQHVTNLKDLSKKINETLGEKATLSINQKLTKNTSSAEFWQRFAQLGHPFDFAPDAITSALKKLYKEAAAMISAKLAAPLDIVLPNTEFKAALSKWELAQEDLAKTASFISVANKHIQKVKQETGNSDANSSLASLNNLRMIKARHEMPIKELADTYSDLGATKARLVTEKEAKKSELDQYDEQIFRQYEVDINDFLARFNTNFKLVKCGKNYVGKVPQSAYCLQFDGADVDISATGDLDPTFDSSLSAGDKNTFALAFFLAQLKRDAEVGGRIVVFDDPFTSLDDFRREMTAKAIVRVGDMASQVIVLSHDKYFLDAVRRKIHGPRWHALQISAIPKNAAISEWDIEREVMDGYLHDHMSLVDFVAGTTSDARSIRMVMRPLLEKYIRYRFPSQIRDGQWLGDMLALIRANPNHPLAAQYQEIDDINEYTAPFHHDPNTPFDPDEVLAHARRTIAIVGGC